MQKQYLYNTMAMWIIANERIPPRRGIDYRCCKVVTGMMNDELSSMHGVLVLFIQSCSHNFTAPSTHITNAPINWFIIFLPLGRCFLHNGIPGKDTWNTNEVHIVVLLGTDVNGRERRKSQGLIINPWERKDVSLLRQVIVVTPVALLVCVLGLG